MILKLIADDCSSPLCLSSLTQVNRLTYYVLTWYIALQTISRKNNYLHISAMPPNYYYLCAHAVHRMQVLFIINNSHLSVYK